VQHGLYDYIGVAYANLCWVALHSHGEVEELAERAFSAWRCLPANYPYPLQWLARAPLVAQLLEAGRPGEAREHLQQLLAPTQAELPAELRRAIESALALALGPGADVLAERLASVVVLARKFAYL
jgi:hypothetical protein